MLQHEDNTCINCCMQVKEENLQRVVQCLCPHFKVFQEINGEMVPYKLETLVEDEPIIEQLPEG